MESVIETENLTKQFGRITALDGLTMQVPRGAVYGFLGPNGAGKTTTIRLLTALIHPTRGSATVLGEDIEKTGARALTGIGCMVEDPAFYDYLSARKNLEIFACMLGGVEKKEIDEVLSMVGLLERASDKVKTFSHGMKQRLGISVAMLKSPELLILDEPTSGLDPKGMVEVREIIRNLASKENVTIFLSSHLLHEVSQVCDHVCVINKGKHIVSGRVDDLLRAEEGLLEVKTSDNAKAERILSSHGMRIAAGKDFLKVRVEEGKEGSVARLLVPEGVEVLALVPQVKTLETFFLEVTEDGTAAAD